MSKAYDNRYSGLALCEEEGLVKITPSFYITGFLWWKKRIECYSVRQVQNIMECMGGHIDSTKYWIELKVFKTKEEANIFAADLIN